MEENTNTVEENTVEEMAYSIEDEVVNQISSSSMFDNHDIDKVTELLFEKLQEKVSSDRIHGALPEEEL